MKKNIRTVLFILGAGALVVFLILNLVMFVYLHNYQPRISAIDRGIKAEGIMILIEYKDTI